MSFKFPKITIYDRYMFKQVALASMVAILLFTIVWVAPEMLLNIIKGALAGEYGLKTAVYLFICELPKILEKAFPVGLLLGSLFTFDKMSKDSELTIFRAVGMSFPRIIAPVVLLGVIFTVCSFLIAGKLTSKSEDKLRAIRGDVISTQYIYAQKDKKGHPRMAVVVSKSYGRELRRVIVLDFSDNIYQDVHQLSHIYSAENGYAYDDRWELRNVTNYKISSEGIFESINTIDKMDILEGESAKNAFTLLTYSSVKVRDINNKNLRRYVKLLKKENLAEEYNSMLNKYLQRFTQPLVCLLMAVLGSLLGFSKPREQKFIGMVIAIGMIFLYYVTLPFFDLLAEKQILSPYITSTLPILAFMYAINVFYKLKDL